MEGITKLIVPADKPLKTYKGFNSDLTCLNHAFEVGKSYHEDEVIFCKKAYHSCLIPNYCEWFYTPSKNLEI